MKDIKRKRLYKISSIDPQRTIKLESANSETKDTEIDSAELLKGVLKGEYKVSKQTEEQDRPFDPKFHVLPS